MKLNIDKELKELLDSETRSINPKLIIDVNNNPTKKGIKVQFRMPSNMDDIKKAEMTTKLKSKLNGGLVELGLSADEDIDVPYEDVIGFTIYLSQFKVLIKNILTNQNKVTNGEKPMGT